MALNAAILFEPEAYVLDGPKLMGRQAAGNAYLRAAVEGRGGEPLAAYTPRRASAEVFAQMVGAIDAEAKAHWIPAGRLDLLSAAGALHIPGPVFREAAMLRLRAGPAVYSLTGVTHTTASHAAMDGIAALPSLPVMPWDALICTSQAVHSTVQTILAAEHEFLSWRFGKPVRTALPQLPVIPLGVHVRDFTFTDEERRSSRAALGLTEGDVAALFVGRLSFHAKAHPHAMYAALEEAAKQTGKRTSLIQCGWFANEAIETAFKQGAARHAPRVRAIFTDGRDAVTRGHAWAAADLFISLSDNIQETFGLAPVEAMAAGLPVIASDWNGYKDTVRDGIDGFRIPTAMPPPDLGAPFAAAHESGELTYDQYCGLACRTVSIDVNVLTERLIDLIKSPELRQKLGASGRQRAQTEFDWRVIYRRYQELWAELANLRAAAARDPKLSSVLATAPRVASARLDPMRAFAHYPTRLIGLDSKLSAVGGATVARYRELSSDPLYSFVPEALPADDLVGALLEATTGEGVSPRDLASRTKADAGRIILALAVLTKMGLVRLSGD